MNKNMFARFIQHCGKNYFKDIALEKDGKLIPLKKIIVSVVKEVEQVKSLNSTGIIK